jgi:AcrR family transcriptional regulator
VQERRAHDRDARRREILEATLSTLTERGYAGTSTAEIARRARTSKETLYAWFGDKAGLLEAMVRAQAGAINEELSAALGDPAAAPQPVLAAFARNLLRLLTGPASVAINRAAIAEAGRSAELGRILAASGRDRTGPLLVRYLKAQHEAGALEAPDPREAFEVLVGLTLRDLQVRVLMGAEEPPSEAEIARRADRAVALFLSLYGPPDDERRRR